MLKIGLVVEIERKVEKDAVVFSWMNLQERKVLKELEMVTGKKWGLADSQKRIPRSTLFH